MLSSLEGLNVVQVKVSDKVNIPIYLPKDWTAQIDSLSDRNDNMVVVLCKLPDGRTHINIVLKLKDGHFFVHGSTAQYIIGNDLPVLWGINVTEVSIRVLRPMIGV